MPAARDQSAEKARLGGRRIDVERLRIEAPAEIDDLLRAEAVAPHFNAVADLEILPPDHACGAVRS